MRKLSVGRAVAGANRGCQGREAATGCVCPSGTGCAKRFRFPSLLMFLHTQPVPPSYVVLARQVRTFAASVFRGFQLLLPASRRSLLPMLACGVGEFVGQVVGN